MESALGIAVSQASGLQMNTGSAVTPFENGKAAMNGIMAAILAQKGLAGAPNAIETKYGFFDCYRRDKNVDEDEFFRALANPYDVIDPGMLLKFYPCGSHTATAVEATLHLTEATTAGTWPQWPASLAQQQQRASCWAWGSRRWKAPWV